MNNRDYVRVPAVQFEWTSGSVAVAEFAMSISTVSVADFGAFVDHTGYIPSDADSGYIDTLYPPD